MRDCVVSRERNKVSMPCQPIQANHAIEASATSTSTNVKPFVRGEVGRTFE